MAFWIKRSKLRRVSISPRDVDETTKREVVNTLGGHPVAMVPAADAMYQDGIHETFSQIRKRDGFWKGYVERLVKSLDLDEDDNAVLQLLSGCRAPIAREVIQQCIDTPIQPALRKLIALCLIDVCSEDRLWLSQLLAVRWCFRCRH